METLKSISRIWKNKEVYSGQPEEVILLYSGILGEKLVKTSDFAGSAVKIIAAFSDKPTQSDFYEVFELEKLSNLIPRLSVKTAILCVPHRQATEMAERLIAAGITRIWNWSGDFVTSDTAEMLNEELSNALLSESGKE